MGSIDFRGLNFENGCPEAIFTRVFFKKKRNSSGSISVQIISKGDGRSDLKIYLTTW